MMAEAANKIGPYKVLKLLNKGTRPLYCAEAPDGRQVAIKAVAVAGLSPEDRARFMRESETCRVLNHPNLICVYDAGEADGMLYQAMELLDGADLDKAISSGQRFSWDDRLSIMEQVCAGLAYAHDRNLVHRDIKPSNLFLQSSGIVKVLDFGMVRLANSTLTRVGSALGTLNYMAPEQIQSDPCTPASDVFSAAIVFYQLASGIHPFASRNQQLYELVSAIVFGATPQLSNICPDVPEGLSAVLEKALQKKPEFRYANAGEFNHAIGLCRTLRSQLVPNGTVGTTTTAGPFEVPVADGKTRIIRRPPRDAGPILPIQRPAPPPKPASIQEPHVRYCPVCTNPVLGEVEICPNCGAPLTKSTEISTINPHIPFLAFYGLLAIAAILAVALVIVIMTK
jgi:serine/threonine protein kinase